MAKALTVKALEAIKPAAARREIPDGLLPGLYHVVQPSGVRSWAVRYRAGGKTRKHTLGPWPALDLATARELGRRALVAVAEGRDPSAEKKAARRADERAADRDLVEQAVASFVERHIKANMRPDSGKETERILNREVVPTWKGKRVQDIRKADVVELLDGIVDRGSPVMANRTLGTVRRLFAWLKGRGLVEASPCDSVAAPAAESSRDRVLSDAELRTLWQACDRIGWPFGPFVRLLILTGQRRDEIAQMRWSELDLTKAAWTLPRARTKNDAEHVVPLAASALAILAELPRIKGKPDYVFTTGSDRRPKPEAEGTDLALTPISGFSRAKRRIDAELLRADKKRAEKEGRAPEEVEPWPRWTLHDIRRSLATGLQRLGTRLEVTEAVLGHVSGSRGGIVGVYQRHHWSDEKRQALEAWGRHVYDLLGATS